MCGLAAMVDGWRAERTEQTRDGSRWIRTPRDAKDKSDVLEYQLVDFKNLIRDRKVISFYETQLTRHLEFV